MEKNGSIHVDSVYVGRSRRRRRRYSIDAEISRLEFLDIVSFAISGNAGLRQCRLDGSTVIKLRS